MRKSVVVLPVVVVGLAAAGWYAWSALATPGLPPGLYKANGRIEVEHFDVATKLPGRVSEVRFREGDLVGRDDIVAVFDSADLLAQRAAAKAAVARAEQGIVQASAAVASAKASLALAEVEMTRAAELLDRAVSPQSTLDQRRAQRDVAAAALAAAEASVGAATAARDAAVAEVALIDVNIADMTLKAPTAGRVEYRLVDPGAVMAAGGKVATLLDLSDVTMTIFLPTRLVGRVRLGADARIVLDAAPDYVVPAKVTFVSSEAQFTPKTVETADEREKLMYRVKVRIDSALLDTYRDYVKAGLTGDAYVLTDPAAAWPDKLAVRLPSATGVGQ